MPSGLALSIVATTDAGTRAALTVADDLSAELDPHIVLWVPHVVPYQQSLEYPAADVSFTAARFRTLAEEARAAVFVHVCVCRPGAAGLETILPFNAMILVGGIGGRWRPTREQRLAQRLTDYGHCVLFIDAESTTPLRISLGRP